MPKRLDTPTFIAKAKKKWGDRFRYDKCGAWKGAEVKFEIYCCKCEEYFFQTPHKHLQGTGCKKCHYELVGLNQPTRKNCTKFIEDAREVHENKYDYSRVEYSNTKTEVWIGCSIHGWFQQTPTVHLRGSGCNECGNTSSSQKQLMTTEQCLIRFREVHGDKYEYPDFVSKGCDYDMVAVCSIHGPWKTTYRSHAIGNCSGCPQCSIISRTISQTSTVEEFIAKAHLLPGYKEKYDYSETKYTKSREKTTIRCTVHDYRFEQKPNKHLCGEEGCHKCQNQGCSKQQLAWLDYIEKTTEGGHIQHKLNGGEFRIPGTRYHADGWRPEINTIYEFHGDLWHGHPLHPDYKENDIHPVIKDKTWGQVYQDTLKKEQKIRDLGYTLIVIWESEWVCRAPKPKTP